MTIYCACLFFSTTTGCLHTKVVVCSVFLGHRPIGFDQKNVFGFQRSQIIVFFLYSFSQESCLHMFAIGFRFSCESALAFFFTNGLLERNVAFVSLGFFSPST